MSKYIPNENDFIDVDDMIDEEGDFDSCSIVDPEFDEDERYNPSRVEEYDEEEHLEQIFLKRMGLAA